MVPSLRRLACLLAAVAAFAGPARAQNVQADVRAFADRLREAEAAHLNLIAPRAFQDAVDDLVEARTRLDKGDRLTDIREALARARQHLREAQELEAIGQVILGDAIAAREDARAARASEVAAAEWSAAEDAMVAAGREVEKGDQNDAREEAQKATTRYRAAELKAIRADVLGTARARRAQAEAAEAPTWATRTWRRAQAKLQEAERALATDRYDVTNARVFAHQAAAQYDHARLLARRARAIDDDPKRRAEEALLEYEDALRRVADALDVDLAFGEGLAAVADRLTASVESRKDDRDNLRVSLRERRQRIDRLQRVVDSLDARLATLEQREQRMSAELQAQRERERRLAKVRNLFDEDEAEIITRPGELVLRVQALDFPVGSAEIRPDNFALLTRVQRVLRAFPDGHVTVAGHTDARGNDAANQRLSEERAEAVRSYLVANMSLDEARIDAVGYGEAQPIATNDTETGRAKNRRIDLTIDTNPDDANPDGEASADEAPGEAAGDDGDAAPDDDAPGEAAGDEEATGDDRSGSGAPSDG